MKLMMKKMFRKTAKLYWIDWWKYNKKENLLWAKYRKTEFFWLLFIFIRFENSKRISFFRSSSINRPCWFISLLADSLINKNCSFHRRLPINWYDCQLVLRSMIFVGAENFKNIKKSSSFFFNKCVFYFSLCT